MTVMKRTNDLKQLGDRYQLLASQGSTNGIDLLGRECREIRQGAFTHPGALPVGLAQQNSRRRGTVRHDLDVHDYILANTPRPVKLVTWLHIASQTKPKSMSTLRFEGILER